ncbi:hypothetical protein YC2023_017417 [Brassica napus]
MLDGLNDKQYNIKTENVWMDKMRKTKTMSYPRLIKVLNKDLDFYEESLDNILPTAYEKFLDKDFDLLVITAYEKVFRTIKLKQLYEESLDNILLPTALQSFFRQRLNSTWTILLLPTAYKRS